MFVSLSLIKIYFNTIYLLTSVEQKLGDAITFCSLLEITNCMIILKLWKQNY